MSWKVDLTKRAIKDARKLEEAGGSLLENAKAILAIVGENPFQNPPPYKRCRGDLKDYLSRRINKEHRFVYKVDKEEKVVTVRSMWGHYDD